MTVWSVRTIASVRVMGLLGLVFVISNGMPQVNALQATPTASPVATTCDVEARSASEIVALIGTLPEGEEYDLVPRPLRLGAPADAATKTAIAQRIRQLEACINAGDQLRLYALFSDEALRRLPKSAETVSALTALEEASPPVSSSEGQRQFLIGPWHVQHLADGRVMAAVRFAFEKEGHSRRDTTKALFLVNNDGRWLIDEMKDYLWVEGDEPRVLVEDVVGPPPDA